MKYAAKLYAPLVKRIMAFSLEFLCLSFYFEYQSMVDYGQLWNRFPFEQKIVLVHRHFSSTSLSITIFFKSIFANSKLRFVNNSFVVSYFHSVAGTKIKSLKGLPLTRQQLGVNRCRFRVSCLSLLVLTFKPNGKVERDVIDGQKRIHAWHPCVRDLNTILSMTNVCLFSDGVIWGE